jgi:hypothetical protein
VLRGGEAWPERRQRSRARSVICIAERADGTLLKRGVYMALCSEEMVSAKQ